MDQQNTEIVLADKLHEDFQKLTNEISKVVIGQEQVVRLLLTSIFCQGHSLLVGVPGLAKTLLIHTIASAVNLSFNR
ncbi:MAG: AAA family ATPase, partial [Cyclobacteriaceae bacterium]